MCKDIKGLPKFHLLQNPASVFCVNLQECSGIDKRKGITNNQNVIYVMRQGEVTTVSNDHWLRLL